VREKVIPSGAEIRFGLLSEVVPLWWIVGDDEALLLTLEIAERLEALGAQIPETVRSKCKSNRHVWDWIKISETENLLVVQ
jgi:hypothetical protein